jgi:hypothetical protein
LLCTSTIHALPALQLPLDTALHPWALRQNQQPLNLVPLPLQPQCQTSGPIYATIHMQSTAEHRVDLSIAVKPTSSDCDLLHPSPQDLLAKLSSKILAEQTNGVSFCTSRGKKPVLLSSSLAHEFSSRKCTVDLNVTLEVGNEAEDRDEIEGMSHAQLGFLMKLFERAVDNLSGALKEKGAEVGTVVLGGELDGVLMRCEFGASCYA